VARARTQLSASPESLRLLRDTIRRPDVLPSRLSLHTQERIIVVEIDNIVHCDADGNNTWFVLASGERIFVTRTLKQFDAILEKHNFLRAHQSHLVNLRYVQEFVKKDGGYLKMKNGALIAVSSRKRAEVLSALE
jgi:two-component system LytT family response regulator